MGGICRGTKEVMCALVIPQGVLNGAIVLGGKCPWLTHDVDGWLWIATQPSFCKLRRYHKRRILTENHYICWMITVQAGSTDSKSFKPLGGSIEEPIDLLSLAGFLFFFNLLESSVDQLISVLLCNHVPRFLSWFVTLYRAFI